MTCNNAGFFCGESREDYTPKVVKICLTLENIDTEYVLAVGVFLSTLIFLLIGIYLKGRIPIEGTDEISSSIPSAFSIGHENPNERSESPHLSTHTASSSLPYTGSVWDPPESEDVVEEPHQETPIQHQATHEDIMTSEYEDL